MAGHEYENHKHEQFFLDRKAQSMLTEVAFFLSLAKQQLLIINYKVIYYSKQIFFNTSVLVFVV